MKPASRAEFHVMGEDAFALAGELTFSSVPGLWREGKRLFTNRAPTCGEIHVDLQRVVRTDSAGLALMIEWLRQASNRNISLRFQNIPRQLLSLVEMAEVDFLFGDSASG